MKQQVHYINIVEERTWYGIDDKKLYTVFKACIQRSDKKNYSNNKVRIYKCSEASILRLAKIQEKLTQ